MGLIKGYWQSKGKYTPIKEHKRILLEQPPIDKDYVAVFKDDLIVRIDIDDYDHKTGELSDPIKGDCRSKPILNYLNDYGFKYVAIKTENGVHIIMKRPEGIPNNRDNWFCPLGIKIEAHVTKVFEPLRVNGIDRQYIKGDLLTDDSVDILPPALIPIQKSADKPFKLSFETGNRNNHFSEYAFYLAKEGFEADDIKEIINALNRYVLEDPLPDREIETILRPDTIEKLKEITNQKKNGVVTPENFKKFLGSLGMSIKYNELLNIVEYENIPDKPEYQNINDVQNMMPIQLKYDFRRFTGKRNISKPQVIDLILLEADSHSYNPVKDYLTGVKWDKKDRFPMLFDILGVTDELNQSFIRKWFYQCASMPFNSLDAPFQAEGVLILQGAEGIGKTRFFQQLAVNPLWFSSLDKELTTKNKDILIQILSVWIAEIGEIDRTFKENKSDVKSFITSRDDTIRKPYRMEHTKKSRTTSFCGTTNKDVLLNSETGSRRWWIVPIKQKIDLSDFIQKENLRQFWAQCYNAFLCDPNCFRLSDDELSQLNERNKDVMELLPAEDELRNSFDFDASINEWEWLSVTELKKLPKYCVDRFTVQQIGRALSAIAKDDERIKRKKSGSKRLWRIPPVYRAWTKEQNA